MHGEKKSDALYYDRVSHELQVEKGHSLEAQKELLTQYALNQGYEIKERKPQCLWLKGTHE